jgi:hypothetical protein
LTELDRVISTLSYPSLERRLGAMRLAGHIEVRPGRSRGTPYAVTDWLRQAVVPLAAAARWERKHAPDGAAAISRLDVEAAFLLAIPMLSLPGDRSGIGRLAVDMRRGPEHLLAGVNVEVNEGRVLSCVARLQGDVDAVATGSALAWLRAIGSGRAECLEIGGDPHLAEGLIEGLHRAMALTRQPR